METKLQTQVCRKQKGRTNKSNKKTNKKKKKKPLWHYDSKPKQSSFLILGFVAVGNREERKKKIPFHMINQKHLEIHSCVCVRYCKENKLLELSGEQQEQKWSDKKQTWLQAEPSNRFLSSTTSSSLGGTMCGGLALNVYHLPQSFPLSGWPFECMCACTDGVGGGGGGSLKNNISLYISKICQAWAKPSLCAKLTLNWKGWGSLQKSSVVIPFFLSFSQPSKGQTGCALHPRLVSSPIPSDSTSHWR